MFLNSFLTVHIKKANIMEEEEMQREEYGEKKVLNTALIEEEDMPGEEKENDPQSIFQQKRIFNPKSEKPSTPWTPR